jgi:hypothetical protein
MTMWLDILEELYKDSWNPGLKRFRAPFAYRGMGRVNHSLASSLVRLADGRADVRRLELALLRNFRKYAHKEGAITDSIWDWLALGQHRGLPTRLLDWTYSPLVALHFATENTAEFGDDGVVWCVNFVQANRLIPRRLKRVLDDEGSETVTVEMLNAYPTLKKFDASSPRPFVVFLEPPAVDARIMNQLALFSLMSSPTARLDDWLAAHPEVCRRVRIPASLKWEIRDKLDQANVNERVLFPGLDGLSRWLTRYYMPAPRASADVPRDPAAADPGRPGPVNRPPLPDSRGRRRSPARAAGKTGRTGRKARS